MGRYVRLTEDETRAAITALLSASAGTPAARACSKFQRSLGAWPKKRRRSLTPLERGGREQDRKFRKAQKLAHRQDIRTAVFLRAAGVCECGCGGPLVAPGAMQGSYSSGARGEMDHMFGRGKGRLPEGEGTCWAIRTDCHREKTNNRPNAATWWRRFAAHAKRYGHLAEAREAMERAVFVETRSRLPCAPRTR